MSVQAFSIVIPYWTSLKRLGTYEQCKKLLAGFSFNSEVIVADVTIQTEICSVFFALPSGGI